MFRPFIRTFSLSLATAFPLAGPIASAGDTDDTSLSARLELGPAAVGGMSRIDLRTCSPTSPFVLFLSAGVGNVDLDGVGPIPHLRAFGPGSLLFVLATDATGRFAVQAPVPANPALQGATLFAQALTVQPNAGLEVTNLAATTFTPGAATGGFVDHSASVPAVGKNFSSGKGAAQDLDGDGDPDIVLITGATGSVHVLRNDGALAFTDVTATAIPGSAVFETADVELLDANGDRWMDILVIGGAGDPSSPPLPNLLLLGQDGLTFVPSALPSVPGIARAVAIADLDCDGDLDLVFANGVDGVHSSELPAPNTILVNQGGVQGGVDGDFAIDLAFQSAPWNGPDHNSSVAAGDIDDDGDVDLFFGRIDTQGVDGTPGQHNVLLRNDGGLVFTDISSTHLQPHFSDNTQGARFGDLDGDGRLDLIVANTTVSIGSAQSGDYYRNQGGGVFVEDNASFPQIDESEIALRNGVHLDDVDLDGDLDVIEYLHEFLDFDFSSGASTGGDDLLFVNQGGAQGGAVGTFVLDPGFTATAIFVTSDHIIADFDLDGDDDIYVSNSGGFLSPMPFDDRLLENVRIP